MLLKKHPLNEAEVVDLFNSGETIEDIIKETKTSRPAIRAALKRNGIDTRANATANHVKGSPLDDNAEFVAALGTDTDRAIAARFGTTAQTVCNHRKRREIKPYVKATR